MTAAARTRHTFDILCYAKLCSTLHRGVRLPCPLYPQKRTCASHKLMSALPPKADMCGALANVCFGPKADIKSIRSLVGNGEYGWRHLDAECPRGLHVDDELEFGRLQHRQVTGLGALEDAAGIDADLTKDIREVGSVTHQPAGFHRLTDRISRW